MPSTSDTGHAKNVANFQDLIEFVIGYGVSYNPSNPALALPTLIALKDTAQTDLDNVTNRNTLFNIQVDLRLDAFIPLRPLSTRLVNALKATQASDPTIENAEGFNRKIQGKRASKPHTPTAPDTPVPTSISSSQQSYDLLIEHLKGLIAVLENESTYSPNEEDLKIPKLKAYAAELHNRNTALATAYAAVSNARIARDKTLYTTENNLKETANNTKAYIKSLFGANSPEYDQVKVIKFTRPRK